MLSPVTLALVAFLFAGTAHAATVRFSIQPGTGQSPWNSPAAPLQAKVGDTIAITNRDSIVHRMHTDGRPCAHGTTMQPGQTSRCVVTSAFDSARTPNQVYDHFVGPSADFFVKTTR